MIVRYAKSKNQPTLNSYFVSHFTAATLELIKSLRPLSYYHRSTQEYELPSESYRKLTEPVERFFSDPFVPVAYVRRHFEKYGYQTDAVEFLRHSKVALINFEQGMGKSFTTMKVALDHSFQRTLVICGQSNLQEEWLKDARKHELLDALSMRIIGDDSDASHAKKAKWLRSHRGSQGFDLINVEALRSDAVVQELNASEYDCLVFDEVQSAKGWKAHQTEGLHDLVRTPGQYRIALSGTPVLNSPFEFFSVLKFFGMLDGTARTTFEKYYGEWGFDFWGHYVCKSYRHLDELKELLAPVLCYADKSELHLPEKRRVKVSLPFDSEEFNTLAKLYKYPTARLKRAGYKSKPEVRAKMQYLSSVAESKIQFVIDQAKNARILVFSSFTRVLDEYEARLTASAIPTLYYHGGLNMRDRLSVLDKWAKGEGQVLLLSGGAARYGLNLVEAKTVIFVDIPSSLSVIAQCEDRTHRIGQTEPVTSYLLSTSKIDEDALSLVASKQETLDSLLGS